ncbi:glycoside hydrolase family 36 protein [Nonomuraea angiospora]|uniref:glycoside hydrolase family 36 protein n=1 Tax=Nonomuraea angiospora TaxID=46172 RepID=UPI0029A00B0D|nr:glycoside hydrolase family 36 protein [Nonomuraea angiospora]MDX3104633.1 alpha-galactosidase [Nonomuraea angiospora]
MTSRTIQWRPGSLDLVLERPEDAPARIARLGTASPAPSPVAPFRVQPLVELMVLGEGRGLSNTRFTDTAAGSRLRFVDAVEQADGDWRELRVRQRDEVTGLEATSVFRARTDVPALQTWTEVTNTGPAPRVLQMVSSFASGALPETADDGDLVLWRARADWCAEGRWAAIPLSGPDGLADINSELHRHDGRGALVTVSKSTWSSGEYLPTGVLASARTGRAWGWQIEHNGAWRWELDRRRDGANAVSLVLSGPTDLDHQWSTRLLPGESFVAVPVSVAVSDEGCQGALAALTRQRRAIRRAHPTGDALPVIFNDYMNTLMGDPTTERLLPLIDAAAESGAEYFCIDAGWYDDGGKWWDSVGEWRPSTGRFPDGGLARVFDHIRARGMRPGLWLEPEVVGVRSPVAATLPDEAFLSRNGERVVEHGRYFLDLRHPSARKHLDEVVDRLVHDYGTGFFKLDYNVTPGPGTDRGALQPGEGLLEHNRAHLEWLDDLLGRHPEVIFENCASGAMRADYAMLSRLQLQSTSDQQDWRLYAAIAASAPATMLPEQAGNWAYPQPGMPPEALAFTMINGLAGRLYLSGHLNRMSRAERELVADGVAVHKRIRAEVAKAEPFWPLGLPAWSDDVVALGLRTGDTVRLAVWQRDGGPHDIQVDLPGLRGRRLRVETEYPATLPGWQHRWDASTARLTVRPAVPGPSARLLRLRPEH